MMEEVGDDTNGESTFEFVGGKSDEIPQKADVVTSTTPSILEKFISPSIPSTTSATSFTQAVEQVMPSSLPQEIQNQPLDIKANVASSNSVPLYMSATKPASLGSSYLADSVPMFQSTPADNSFFQLHKPPGEEFMPIQSTQPSFVSPSTSAAIDLPIDDNFVSSSSQHFQDRNDKGVWGWIKGNDFLNKVAEKAKNSVDSMITTLDPGMKEIIYSGGDVSIVVASSNEEKISAIREAFQQVFGRATVQGITSQSTSIAPQPVGYSAGLKAAEERIINLQRQGFLRENQAIIAIENFLAELTPDRWFDIGCLLLQDPGLGSSLQVYTEAIPVSSHCVMQAKEQTPPDYALGWSGFAVTIGQILGPVLGVHHSEWHQALTGVSHREINLLAARTLAGMYKTQSRR